MKKIIIFFLCLTMLFALIGCGSNDNDSYIQSLKDRIDQLEQDKEASDNRINQLEQELANILPDFADCKIGYQLEVYPKVSFEYELDSEAVFYIETVTATLTSKNEIADGSKITGSWYPYEVTLCIKGNIDVSHANKKFYASFYTNSTNRSISGAVNADGTFDIESVSFFNQNCVLSFRAIAFN